MASAATTGKKFVFRNGVLVRLDQPTATGATAASLMTASPSEIPLAVVCSADELADATAVAAAQGVTTTVPDTTQNSIVGFYDDAFLAGYRSQTGVDGQAILDHLGTIFSSLEIPLGVLAKLLALASFNLNFIIDDSGSMQCKTDSDRHQAGSFLLQRYRRKGLDLREAMTRWEEVEDRLHTMMEVIAYIPTGIISISFLNRPTFVNLDRTGLEPAAFLEHSHIEIEKLFLVAPTGGTPIFTKLQKEFKRCVVPTMHYLFTDGEPSDSLPIRVKDLVLSRPNPIQHPITFVSCTNEDSSTDWMKDLDSAGPMIAEVDDYEDEKREVLSKQGPILPYTRGLWLMSLIVGAINPDDLDCLDDSEPMSKFTLSGLMGRDLTDQEYFQYFSHHPRSGVHQMKYYQFANSRKPTSQIINRVGYG